ncbi:unnamed protein product, partial [Owenia fusiformis]
RYDHKFRKARATDPCKWSYLDQQLRDMCATMPKKEIGKFDKRPNNVGKNPKNDFPNTPNKAYSESDEIKPYIPFGYCFKFHKGEDCKPNCTLSHKCPAVAHSNISHAANSCSEAKKTALSGFVTKVITTIRSTKGAK